MLKGCTVIVTGEIQYTQKDDKTYTVIHVNKLEIVGKSAASGNATLQPQKVEMPAAKEIPSIEDEDGLPF